MADEIVLVLVNYQEDFRTPAAHNKLVRAAQFLHQLKASAKPYRVVHVVTEHPLAHVSHANKWCTASGEKQLIEPALALRHADGTYRRGDGVQIVCQIPGAEATLQAPHIKLGPARCIVASTGAAVVREIQAALGGLRSAVSKVVIGTGAFEVDEVPVIPVNPGSRVVVASLASTALAILLARENQGALIIDLECMDECRDCAGCHGCTEWDGCATTTTEEICFDRSTKTARLEARAEALLACQVLASSRFPVRAMIQSRGMYASKAVHRGEVPDIGTYEELYREKRRTSLYPSWMGSGADNTDKMIPPLCNPYGPELPGGIGVYPFFGPNWVACLYYKANFYMLAPITLSPPPAPPQGGRIMGDMYLPEASAMRHAWKEVRLFLVEGEIDSGLDPVQGELAEILRLLVA